MREKLIRRIIIKIIKYLIFTIAIAWSPMIINWIISSYYNLGFIKLYLYTSEIYFMTIILSSTNIKDILESEISKDSFIFIIHIFFNIAIIVLCIIFISISSFTNLSNNQFNVSIIKEDHFNFVISMYIVAAFLGSGVQIGCAIKQINENTNQIRRKE